MKVIVLFALVIAAVSAGPAEDAWREKNYIPPALIQSGFIELPSPKLPESYIIGGQDANIAQFPYQLSLRQGGNHICGASIISAIWVLSAAHCLDSGVAPGAITFRAGSNNRLSGGTIYNTAQYILHPQYNRNSLANDVAVARTTANMGGANIASIPLVPSGTTFAAGTNGVVSGWGLTSSGQLATILQQVTIPVVAQATCNNQWGGGILASMVCAGAPGRDSCNGDSGGPLINGGRQFGIVSWGAANCGGNLPGVYANIGNAGVRNFIQQHSGV